MKLSTALTASFIGQLSAWCAALQRGDWHSSRRAADELQQLARQLVQDPEFAAHLQSAAVVIGGQKTEACFAVWLRTVATMARASHEDGDPRPNGALRHA